MKKIILLLSLMVTINCATNSFPINNATAQVKHQKYLYAKQAASKGNVRAQFDLAMMYATGSGVGMNQPLAFKYFHKAARKGHARAKFFMGLSFAEGKGVKQQLELARYWLKLAVKAGNREAITYLRTIENSLGLQQGKTRIVALNY